MSLSTRTLPTCRNKQRGRSGLLSAGNKRLSGTVKRAGPSHCTIDLFLELLAGSGTEFMRRIFHYIAVVALAWMSGETMAQYASIPEADLFRTDEQRYDHLEYFGFYASAMAHWNYTEDLAPCTNLTWIHDGSAADEAGAIDAMVERMRQARDAGVQAVLSLEPFLFANKRGDLRPDVDTEGFLVELRARLESEELLDTLLMIYPKDEPFREFVRYRDPSYYEQYI